MTEYVTDDGEVSEGQEPADRAARARPYLPAPRKAWETMSDDEKKAHRHAFTIAKLEMQRWMQSDPALNSDAIRVAIYILHCVNCETLQCNPSQPTIADELNLKLRTVERCISSLRKVWLAPRRFNRTKSNSYTLVADSDRVREIEERLAFKKQWRERERIEGTQRRRSVPDPSPVAGRENVDPSPMAVPDPSPVAAKHRKRTHEDFSL